MARGREAYERAMADPDSLAELVLEPTGPDGEWEFEEIYYVTLEVHEEKGGDGDVRDYAEPEAGLGGPGPSGEPFPEDEAELQKRYPRLWQRFVTELLGVIGVFRSQIEAFDRFGLNQSVEDLAHT